MNCIRNGRPMVGLVFAIGLLSNAAVAKERESWDAIYVGGAKVGHMHVWVEPVKDKAGNDLVRVRIDWELAFDRGRDRARMMQHYGTIERPDGEVLSLDTRTRAGQADIRTYGTVVDGVMKLTIESGGKAQSVPIPWGAEVRGPYGAEMSLSRQPIKPGEVREVRTYIPDLNKVCATKLSAKDFEDIPIGLKGEKRNLLRIDQTVADEAGKPVTGMNSTLWVDKSGQILKTHADLLGGMDIFRTTKAGALSDGGGVAFNLLEKSIIRVPRPIPSSEKTRDVSYRITMENDAPAEVFLKDRRQAARPDAAKGAAVLEVKTAGPRDGDAEGEAGAEFLRANPMVNSDDALVAKHMKKALGGEADPWAKAVAIQKWVSSNIREKNFSVAFAPAAEVARNLEGDCSEHSVLVAAMCRAAGIPSRCVVGLVYAQNLGGFGPHMWNEVYVNRRWVALDAAFDQSEVDATHLKLATTSLDGVAPFEAFLPVLKVFDKIKIEPIEIR